MAAADETAASPTLSRFGSAGKSPAHNTNHHHNNTNNESSSARAVALATKFQNKYSAAKSAEEASKESIIHIIIQSYYWLRHHLRFQTIRDRLNQSEYKDFIIVFLAPILILLLFAVCTLVKLVCLLILPLVALGPLVILHRKIDRAPAWFKLAVWAVHLSIWLLGTLLDGVSIPMFFFLELLPASLFAIPISVLSLPLIVLTCLSVGCLWFIYAKIDCWGRRKKYQA